MTNIGTKEAKERIKSGALGRQIRLCSQIGWGWYFGAKLQDLQVLQEGTFNLVQIGSAGKDNEHMNGCS